MNSIPPQFYDSQRSTIRLAIVALCCTLLVNGLLVLILYKLQQAETKDVKKYALRDVSIMKVEPQRLKLPERQIPKPKRQQKQKPKLIKKRIKTEKPPPITPIKMQLPSLAMNLRLLPMPQLTAVVVPTRVVEDPVEQPVISEPDIDIYELGMVDKAPQALIRNPPIYPAAAKRLGVEGWVDVSFVVDEAGKVVDVTIINSSSRRFDQAARSAVYSWRFNPAVKNHQKVSVICRQKLKFEMHN